MKYTIQSFKYIIKNFFYIFPFVIVPAICLALSLDQTYIKNVLEGVFSGNPNFKFFEIFGYVSILGTSSWKKFLMGVAGVVCLIFFSALLMALIEKHMRIGKKNLGGIFSRINDNLISTAGVCLLYVVLYEIWAFVASAILYMVSLINETIAVYVLSALILLGMHFVLLYIVSIFYLLLPCLQITGFKAFEAFRYSYQLVSPIKLKIVFGQWINIIIMEILFAVCIWFIPSKLVTFIIATLFYSYMILMFCVRMHVVYFDRAQIERADLLAYYHFY